jgi:hypothetical protein
MVFGVIMKNQTKCMIQLSGIFSVGEEDAYLGGLSFQTVECQPWVGTWSRDEEREELEQKSSSFSVARGAARHEHRIAREDGNAQDANRLLSCTSHWIAC